MTPPPLPPTESAMLVKPCITGMRWTNSGYGRGATAPDFFLCKNLHGQSAFGLDSADGSSRYDDFLQRVCGLIGGANPGGQRCQRRRYGNSDAAVAFAS